MGEHEGFGKKNVVLIKRNVYRVRVTTVITLCLPLDWRGQRRELSRLFGFVYLFFLIELYSCLRIVFTPSRQISTYAFRSLLPLVFYPNPNYLLRSKHFFSRKIWFSK